MNRGVLQNIKILLEMKYTILVVEVIYTIMPLFYIKAFL
jgi:hypothetical protein